MVDPSSYCPDWGLVGMVTLSAVIVVAAVAFSVATCGAGTVFAAVAIGAVVGAGVGGGPAAVLGGRVGGTVTNGSKALLAFGIGRLANIAAKGISDSILKHKVSSISNMNRKGQSLAIQQLEGLPQNMGSHVLKGSYRNAFKNYSKTQISSLVNNSSTWLKYGIYSSITSVNLSTMPYYVW